MERGGNSAMQRIDHLFDLAEARFDKWRDLLKASPAVGCAGRNEGRGDAEDPLRGAAWRDPAGRGLPRLSRRPAACDPEGPRGQRRRGGCGTAGAAHLRGADAEELSPRRGGVGAGRGPTGHATMPAAAHHRGGGTPVLRSAVRRPDVAVEVAAPGAAGPPAAASAGRVHLRAGVRRQLGGRGLRHAGQSAPRSGGDPRGIRVGVDAQHAAAARGAGGERRRRPVRRVHRRPRPHADPGGQVDPARTRRVPARRLPAGGHRLGPGGQRPAARVL